MLLSCKALNIYKFFVLQTMNIKPLGNRTLVKLVKQQTTSNSGIILTTKEENEQARGEVLVLGPGLSIENEINISDLGISVGDVVMFGRYAGEEVKDPNDPDTVYKIVPAKDIIAVIS